MIRSGVSVSIEGTLGKSESVIVMVVMEATYRLLMRLRQPRYCSQARVPYHSQVAFATRTNPNHEALTHPDEDQVGGTFQTYAWEVG